MTLLYVVLYSIFASLLVLAAWNIVMLWKETAWVRSPEFRAFNKQWVATHRKDQR
jgi:hypothetical protein